MTSASPSSDDSADQQIRTRAVGRDPHYGLKGHAYIAARNLNTHVQRVQTSAHQSTFQAEAK